MRSQHKFVITAGLLCHLFTAAPLVASQALTDQAAQNPPAPAEQAAPSPTPVEPPAQGAAAPAEQPSNCHLLITSPPAAHQSAQPAAVPKPEQSATGTQAAKKSGCRSVKNALSSLMPASVRRQATFTPCAMMWRFASRTMIFAATLVTYNAGSGDVTAKGHVSLDGGRRDMHISATEGVYNIHSQTGKFYDVRGGTGARF